MGGLYFSSIYTGTDGVKLPDIDKAAKSTYCNKREVVSLCIAESEAWWWEQHLLLLRVCFIVSDIGLFDMCFSVIVVDSIIICCGGEYLLFPEISTYFVDGIKFKLENDQKNNLKLKMMSKDHESSQN